MVRGNGYTPPNRYCRRGLRYRTSEYMVKEECMLTPGKPRDASITDDDTLPTDLLHVGNCT